jgi:hypothetical protein
MEQIVQDSLNLIRANLASPGDVRIVVRFINDNREFMLKNRTVHYALDDLVHFLGDQDICEKSPGYDQYMRKKLTEQVANIEAEHSQRGVL